MANAKPSRPGVNQTAGKLEVNIPSDVQLVKKPDGTVVRRTEYASGTIRETQVFEGDHKDAKPFVDTAAIEAEEKLREEIRAELLAEQEADKKAAEKKPVVKAKAGK